MTQISRDEGGLDLRTHPDSYRHWKISLDGPVAYLEINVGEDAPKFVAAQRLRQI